MLGIEDLLTTVRKSFAAIPAPKRRASPLSQTDLLLSGYAIFSLKYPSLLQFDQSYRENKAGHNLRSVYRIEHVPSDTQMRERLDQVDPRLLRKTYPELFSQVQKSQRLELFHYLDDRYLFSIDGTEYFQSEDVHCIHCGERHHRNGHTSYYHQMLAGTLVHPDQKVVIPFAPEPIMKSDGKTKNDCERNAAFRLLDDLKREYPDLKLIITGDGLFSNGPLIERLKEDGHRFLLVAKEGDHAALFERFQAASREALERVEGKTTHHFRWANGLPLNATHPKCLVNVLAYEEERVSGPRVRWVWVTDLPLTSKTVWAVMRGGRARHKIENETFNTLKNQGYHFEHNFGHGKKHLTTVFAHLMMLAFFVDQLQQLGCPLFRRALERLKSKKMLWEHLRGLFLNLFVENLSDLWTALADDHHVRLTLDSS